MSSSLVPTAIYTRRLHAFQIVPNYFCYLLHYMEVKSFQIVPRMNAFQTNIEDVSRGGRFPKFTWITCGDVLVCEHRTWQRARNFFKFFPRHTHTIRRQLDKFHDFRNSFAFYTIKKPLPRKLAALPREHVDPNFETVPRFSLNLH